MPAHGNGRPNSAGNTGLETADEPQEVLYSCQRDLISLWNDRAVREILKRKKVRLEEFPGLYVNLRISRQKSHVFLSYLNDLERVTSLEYMPSDGIICSSLCGHFGLTRSCSIR